jgi:rod shape determining protein RodA
LNPYLRKLFRFNWVLLALIAALCVSSVVAIYCATFMRDPNGAYAYLVATPRLQAIWIAAGFAVFVVVSLIDYRWVKWGALPVYITGVALLVYCNFKGVTVFGAKSWIRIGGLTLQPSQVAILGGILVISVLLSEFRRLHPMLKMVICGVIALPPVLLVAKQPQLGGVLVWGPVVLTMLFVGGIPVRYLMAVILTVVAVMPLAAHMALKDFQFKRLTTFFHPEEDPLGAGWTIINSMTAIGSGGWSGKGFKAHDTLVEQGMLPQTISHTDFIFSVIGEAFGFVGSASIITIFAFLLLTGLYISYQAKDQLGLLMTVGVMSLLFTHIVMNAGMTISLTPIAGLPLPLVSYGGTFVVIVMLAMGMVQSVWIHRKTLR